MPAHCRLVYVIILDRLRPTAFSILYDTNAQALAISRQPFGLLRDLLCLLRNSHAGLIGVATAHLQLMDGNCTMPGQA